MTAEASTLQRQLYGIGIFEEEIVITDFTGDIERRFVVTPEQLMGFCRTESTFRPFPGLVWMKTGGAADTYLIVLPAAKRTILYRRAGKISTKRLTLPSIAVRASIDPATRKVSDINMWGFAGSTLKPGNVLYQLPLPNLSGSNLCLGSTERAFNDDVHVAVEKTIFDTPFNHHSYLVGLERLPFHDYVKKYQGLCPLKTLKPIGHGRNILGGTR